MQKDAKTHKRSSLMFNLSRKKKRLINHFFYTVRGEYEYS